MHTKEPWFTDGKRIWRRDPSELYENGGDVGGDRPIASANIGWSDNGYPQEANARRIVACVNACQSLHTEWLKSNHVAHEFRRLEKQRDELLEALKVAREYMPHDRSDPGYTEDAYKEADMVDKAIAKVEAEE